MTFLRYPHLERYGNEKVAEELWDCLKKINNGSVNFQELKHLCIQKVKQTKPELF